jgi:hypothetical protein
MKGSVLRIVAGTAVVAVLMTAVAVPASAAVTPLATPILNVANLAPGDHWRRGSPWLAGVACDPSASLTDTSAGIARIQIFVGDRDTGQGVPAWRPGGYAGQATASGLIPDFSSNAAQSSRLGLVNPDVSVGCKHTYAGFRLLPSAFRRGTWQVNIYVLTKAGKETKTTFEPIIVDQG